MKAISYLINHKIMKEIPTQYLQEIVNLLYHILIKMPHPSDLVPKPLPQQFRWLDNQDLMLLLHVSDRTLQRWRTESKLPFSKIKGKIWYLESDVNEMVKEGL